MSFFGKFPGGVHPQEGMGGKSATAGIPIVHPPQPSRVSIPLQQHIGAPSKCLVKAGDRVRVGQMIGEPVGFVSAAVHASISGRVVGCQPCIQPNGTQQDCVIIDNDFQDTWVELVPAKNPENLSAQELAEISRNAGIVGLGGATFPQSVKLSIPADKHVDTLILNGSECEPYLSADHRLMLENAQQIVRGALLIQKALKISKIIIGIENNKADAIQAMTDACKDAGDISVISLPARYPQGGEKQLVYALTGRTVKMGGLPLGIGVIVMNVGSVYALYRAVYEGRPLIDRVVTVGGSVSKPANYFVRIGTPVEWLIDTSEGILPQARMLIYGGPMMGVALSRRDIPITKACSGIVALENLSALAEEKPCIRCGRCVEACPVKISPALIDRFMRKDMFDEAEKLNVMNCIDCGICSWSCPAKRHLTQSMKVCKSIITQKRKRASEKKEEK